MLPEFGIFPSILFFSGEKCKYLANMCVCALARLLMQWTKGLGGHHERRAVCFNSLLWRLQTMPGPAHSGVCVCVGGSLFLTAGKEQSREDSASPRHPQ